MSSDVAIYSAHDEIRLLLRGLLRLHRFRVVGEGSDPTALQHAPGDASTVVVLDADLDEIGWLEGVHALRRARPEMRIVLLSASGSPRIETHAKSLGIAAVVRRPFAVHHLIEAVNGSTPPPVDQKPPEGPVRP
jgi:DNA-binding NarL/FixJ family response regulator